MAGRSRRGSVASCARSETRTEVARRGADRDSGTQGSLTTAARRAARAGVLAGNFHAAQHHTRDGVIDRGAVTSSALVSEHVQRALATAPPRLTPQWRGRR